MVQARWISIGVTGGDRGADLASIGGFQKHFVVGDCGDNIVKPVLMPSGFCTGRKGETGDAGAVIVD